MASLHDRVATLIEDIGFGGMHSPSSDALVGVVVGLVERERQAAREELKENAVYAEAVSYRPADHDGIKNWPIVQRPVYIVPADLLTQKEG